ncbi:MAG TPA: PEP-CTERM sorting domain-containing protein [Phycisphaerae bacterium]|nr:PEP-CTERM sorting domain-containing protein [Phycisphaerae bacterium]HRY70246.1 PEP-CTERM sorting domain-containing protein [Phycisphaerae bacterium]HSA27583.1 PEP-CTERM sorting domain-containing protein [Phycisphaerae bacterium]
MRTIVFAAAVVAIAGAAAVGLPGTAWQPIESSFNGYAGETYPMEPAIPWDGMWGTNHQYVGSDGANTRAWLATGPGPHTPESAAQNAGANGIYMWLKQGSTLYAKWDFGWDITRAWSAIRLTSVDTGTSWILPIDRLDGDFTAIPGAGYSFTTAYEGSGINGTRRVWWNFNAADVPTTTALYTIEAYGVVPEPSSLLLLALGALFLRRKVN